MSSMNHLEVPTTSPQGVQARQSMDASSSVLYEERRGTPYPVPDPESPIVRPIGNNDEAPGAKKKILGISRLTACLYFLMFFLIAVVAGLTPGIVIIDHKSQKAKSQLKAAEYATSLSNITNGCSDDVGGTTRRAYTSFYALSTVYTMYCNRDPIPSAIYSLFAGNFNSCMESCTLWNLWHPNMNESGYPYCQAVAFVPDWSNIQHAAEGNRQGNCFLRAKPMSIANLTVPSVGTEIHSAISNSEDDGQ